MAKLLGFSKPKKESGGKGSSDQMLRILEKTYLNRTPNGQFTNTREVDGFLDALKRVPQTPDVMEKVADLENKKLQFTSKQSDILNSKSLFEDNLNDALRVEAKNNYKDIPLLINAYLNVYAEAEDQIDQYINDNVTKKYGASTEIPQDIINLKKSIKEKAKKYSTLNTFINIKGGEENINSAGLAIKMETNPISGSIVSVDVVSRTELSKDYLGTDIKAKMGNTSVPIYLNAQSGDNLGTGDVSKTARLGTMEFRGVQKLSGTKIEKDATLSAEGSDLGVGILKAQNEHVGMFSWLNGRNSDAEKFNSGLDLARSEGIDFKDFKFDGNDIQSGSVVRKGNRLYFSNEDGNLSEFEGGTYSEKQDNARNYLSQTGQDPDKVKTPKYADDTFFVASDGGSKIKNKIGANFFTPQAPSSPDTSVFSQPAPSSPTGDDGTSLTVGSSFFGDRVNRRNKPNEKIDGASKTAIESGAATSTSLVDKAIGFFRNKVVK